MSESIVEGGFVGAVDGVVCSEEDVEAVFDRMSYLDLGRHMVVFSENHYLDLVEGVEVMDDEVVEEVSESFLMDIRDAVKSL